MKRLYCLLNIILIIIATHTSGQVISTIAGTGTGGYSGDGGPATAAMFDNPLRVYVDSAGYAYISDNSARVRVISPAGIVATFAGNGTLTHGGDGGPATAAGIGYARDVKMDKYGNIYLAETRFPLNFSSYIRKIDAAGIITTIAGNGLPGSTGDGGPATAASFGGIRGIELDTAGNIYVADNSNHVIRKINTGGIVSTIAGTGTPAFSGDGGAATAAELKSPTSVAIDHAGNIYIADAGNFRIRKIDAAGIITTIAGTSSAGFAGDGGPATAARFNTVLDLCFDAAGNLYAADAFNHRVRIIDPAGIINTIAGTGTSGYSGDCGPATAAEFGNLGGVATDRSGNLYIVDVTHPTVRKVYAPGITDITGPTLACTGATVALSDSVAAGHWASSNTTVATIGSSTGIVTGVGAGITTITYHFTGCYVTDTVRMSASPWPGVITGTDTICPGDAVTLYDTVAGGTWNSLHSTIATVTSAGHVTGLVPGTDTITYTVTVGGCSSTAIYSFVVLPSSACPDGVATVSGKGAGALSVYPDPSGGMFTISLSCAANEPMRIVITNVPGQVVKETTGETNREIPVLLDVAGGLYFITVTTARGERYNARVEVRR